MWRATDLDGLELLGATVRQFAFHPHAHEEFFIALTEDGVATPTYRGDSHVIGPGDLIVLNPDEPHAGGPPAHAVWTYRALYPHPDLMRGLMAEFAGVSDLRCPISAWTWYMTGTSRGPDGRHDASYLPDADSDTAGQSLL